MHSRDRGSRSPRRVPSPESRGLVALRRVLGHYKVTAGRVSDAPLDAPLASDPSRVYLFPRGTITLRPYPLAFRARSGALCVASQCGLRPVYYPITQVPNDRVSPSPTKIDRTAQTNKHWQVHWNLEGRNPRPPAKGVSFFSSRSIRRGREDKTHHGLIKE